MILQKIISKTSRKVRQDAKDAKLSFVTFSFFLGVLSVLRALARKKKSKVLVITMYCTLLFFACSGKKTPEDVQPASTAAAKAKPLAILQTGEHPLWFQLTEKGPVLLESIEDAIFSAALIPWPLALHICFFREKENELIMVVNRDGFMKLAPYDGAVKGLALYRFSGGEFWRQYTAGGFVFYEDKPAALLYLDDRFLDSDSHLPLPRTWTFNMESNALLPLNIPALEIFPAEEGWNADTLRAGSDNRWYYRVKRQGAEPEIRMLRTADLANAGVEISLEDFQNSAPREPENFEHPLLPALPENFIYTGIGFVDGSLFACWEEQEDFNIGAAGFLLVKP
ncbi:MAG: hypothetical protein LBH44_03445 [Treponema sp.]|jgi:hypothetical protein|nr:hypothetical protein [Treponema sp.]